MSTETRLKPRKKPQQRRSAEMNELIIAAAIRVLEREGPEAFTTTRVAEVAGVSVGSFYQYYPNKDALLFCLHEREANQTWCELQAILDDTTLGVRERLFRAVHRFVETESAEADLRTSLQIAEVLFYETPEFRAIEQRAAARIRQFLREALPRRRDLDFETELVLAIVAGVAERVTRRPLPPAQICKVSRAVSEMLCQHLGL